MAKHSSLLDKFVIYRENKSCEYGPWPQGPTGCNDAGVFAKTFPVYMNEFLVENVSEALQEKLLRA